MKRAKRKLTIDGQTLRILSATELNAAGGLQFSAPLSGCDSCSACCKPPA